MPDNRYQGVRVSTSWDYVLSQAERQGVHFKLNSGRRTMREQWTLVRAKGVWSPSNPHGAARPTPWAPHIRVGRQDHAIDVNQPDGGLFGWLAQKGLRPARTVPTESWHIEVDRARLARYAKEIRHYLRTR